ncbi:MAG TPA: hypothetical protein VHD56_14965, partial [Tepidisphaeraceae bacterium]|nr:hypothetical protein [Tepidisphaeraceae bacterium]
GLLKQTEDSVELAMLHHTRRRLTEIGCPPYEISNYAVPGQECLHNLLYWTGGNYIGLGPSAASHVNGQRLKNRPHLGEWEQAVDRAESATGETELLTAEQRAGELIMLSLRLTQGINFSDYADRTGFDAQNRYRTSIHRLAGLGLLHVDNRGFRLTEAGLNVADSIAAEFLSPAPI